MSTQDLRAKATAARAPEGLAKGTAARAPEEQAEEQVGSDKVTAAWEPFQESIAAGWAKVSAAPAAQVSFQVSV